MQVRSVNGVAPPYKVLLIGGVSSDHGVTRKKERIELRAPNM